MDNFEEVIEFIEKYYNVKLYDYQKKMIEWISKGYTFSSPIKCGKKMVLDGYIKYLENKYCKHIPYQQAEKHIVYTEVCKENWIHKKYLEAVDSDLKFKTEYECVWIENDQLKG